MEHIKCLGKIEKGKVVKLSTTFLRSIGCQHPNAEHRGKVVEIVGGWLATVQWTRGEVSTVNVYNLVLIEDVDKEYNACKVPGLVLDSNAFLKFDA